MFMALDVARQSTHRIEDGDQAFDARPRRAAGSTGLGVAAAWRTTGAVVADSDRAL